MGKSCSGARVVGGASEPNDDANGDDDYELDAARSELKMDGSCFYLRPPFGRLTRWRQNSRAKQFVVVVVGAQHNSSGSSSSITVQQQPQGRNKQINMNIKPGELSILQLFLTASIIIIIIIKFQTTSASNSLPNGATCVLKPSDLVSVHR